MVWDLVKQPDRRLGRSASERALVPDKRQDVWVAHDRIEALQVQHVGSISVNPIRCFEDKRDLFLQVDG